MSGPGFDVLSVTPASVFSRGDVGAPAHPGRRCPPATPGAHCTDRKTGRAGAQCLLSRRPPPKPSLSSEIPPTPLRLLMRVPYPPRPPGCPEHPETPPVVPAMHQHHAQDSRRGAWGPMRQGDPPHIPQRPLGQTLRASELRAGCHLSLQQENRSDRRGPWEMGLGRTTEADRSDEEANHRARGWEEKTKTGPMGRPSGGRTGRPQKEGVRSVTTK